MKPILDLEPRPASKAPAAPVEGSEAVDTASGEADETPDKPNESGRTRWLLAMVACAGLGVGAGASFAVSRGPGVEVKARALVGAQPTSPRTEGDAKTPLAVAPSPSAGDTLAMPEAGAGANAPATDVLEQAGLVGSEVGNGDPLAGAEDEAPPVLPDEDAPPQHDPASVARLVGALEAAHRQSHASPEASANDKAVAAAVDEVFAKDKVARRFAHEFYAAFGPNRFVKGSALTPLGKKTLALIGELERHALDASRYDRDGLAALSALGDGGDEADGEIRSILRGLIAAPTFDRAEATERIAAMRELPDPTMVIAVAASLSGPTSSPADARLDAKVFEGFLELVLDFRFIKKAGPHTIRSREAVFDRERKKLKDFIAELVSLPRGEGIDRLIPPHPQYDEMLGFYAAYRGYAAAGCEKLPANWRFRNGSKGEEVKKLQARLKCQGFYEGELDGRYEGATVEAVKSFQRHHDLPDEGTVLEETMKALNVSMDYRVKQIALTLQRMREARFDRMGDFFIRVNIPSFLLKVFEHGEMIREHKVIVGTNRLDDDKVNHVQGHINRTKLLGTRLYEVIVNPTWILPKRVEEGELASSLDKDPDHLTKSNIKKVKLGSGTEVFVQGAGDGNVLGKVKFLLEESNAIYLHDTDKRHLFKKQRRDFSHGCMRVHEAIEFGKWLLAHDGWPENEVERAFAAKSLQRGFKLKKPIHTVVEYMTVDVSSEGKPVFFADIYGYDSAFFNDNLPPFEKTRWGSDRLRPRWVPLMDAATVNEWKAKGKPAPRNLGPDGKPKAEPKGKKPAPAAEIEGP